MGPHLWPPDTSLERGVKGHTEQGTQASQSKHGPFMSRPTRSNQTCTHAVGHVHKAHIFFKCQRLKVWKECFDLIGNYQSFANYIHPHNYPWLFLAMSISDQRYTYGFSGHAPSLFATNYGPPTMSLCSTLIEWRYITKIILTNIVIIAAIGHAE